MKKFSNFDRKLRTFKRKVQRSGVLEEYRNRMHYTKPTTRRRNALNAAKRREYNRRINDELPSRTNRLY
jgi:small subunit ribosomal protein S21